MFQIIIGIVFIVGGLSGQFVLRGTDSSHAIVIIGVILLAIGIIQIVKKSRKVGG